MQAVLEIELDSDAVAAAELDHREAEMVKKMRGLVGQAQEMTREANRLSDQLGSEGEGASLATVGAIEDLQEQVSDLHWAQCCLTAEALDHEYTAGDISRWIVRAVEMGCSRPRLDSSTLHDLLRHRKVPNVALRERVLALAAEDEHALAAITNLTREHLQILEEEVGEGFSSKNLLRPDGTPDVTYLQRLLGIEPKSWGKGQKSLQLFITYEQAVAISRALDITPIEAGV